MTIDTAYTISFICALVGMIVWFCVLTYFTDDSFIRKSAESVVAGIASFALSLTMLDTVNRIFVL